MCGKKLDVWDEQESFCFQHRAGYGSEHDGDVVRFKLCCGCFDTIIAIVSKMSKEKIVFSPQELSKNSDYYEKQVKVRGLYSPLTGHIGRQSRPFCRFPAKMSRRLSARRKK
jgi:hypothetical protein